MPVEMEFEDELATDRFADILARSSSASVSEDTLFTEPKDDGSVAGDAVPGPEESCEGAKLSEGGRCVRFVLLTLRTGGGGGGFIVGGFGGGPDGRPGASRVGRAIESVD